MELKSTVQSYDELLSLDMFRENQEVTLENFENILIDYEINLMQIVQFLKISLLLKMNGKDRKS
jgi:hypothetical protein